MSTDLLFDGFDNVAAVLRKAAPQLRYLVVDEVLTRKKTQTIARIHFTPMDLRPYLRDQAQAEVPDDEVDPDEDISDQPTEERDGEAFELGDLSDGADPTEPSPGLSEELSALCQATLRWMRHVARSLMGNRAACTFKIWFHSQKGEYIRSARFVAENPSYRPPLIEAPPPEDGAPVPGEPGPQVPALAQPQPPAVAPPRPQPIFETQRLTPAVALAFGPEGRGQLVFLDPDSIPEARVWRALGRATEEFLGTVGRTYGNIIDLQARTVTHQSDQLDKSQALVENLARQLLAARQVQETEEAESKADAQQLRIREELGKTFLSELGSFGRILATSKLGVAPELMELGDLVATSPELAEAIRDPNVRAMLKDEKTRKELAQLLLLASKKPGSGGPPPQAA